MIKIGFIVRCLNEEQWIGHCLQSIKDIESIEPRALVIDNESSDESLKTVKMFRDFCDVITINRNDYLPGIALNTGMNHFSSLGYDYVCIISAHCVINKFNMDVITKFIEDEKCFGIIGKQVPIYKGKRLQSRYVWENFSKEPIKNLKDGRGYHDFFFHNAFSILKVKDWSDLKFDISITGKEDRVYAKKHIEEGKHFLYQPSLECLHHWTNRCATWSGME